MEGVTRAARLVPDVVNNNAIAVPGCGSMYSDGGVC